MGKIMQQKTKTGYGNPINGITLASNQTVFIYLF